MLSKSNPLLVTRSHLFSTALVAMLALQFLSRHRGLPMPQAIFYQLLFKQRLLHVYFGEPVLPTAQSRSHGQVWHCGSFRIVSDHFLARTPFALAFGFGVALKHVSSRPAGTAWKNPKKTLKKIHSSYKWGLPIAVTWAMSITNSNTEDEVSFLTWRWLSGYDPNYWCWKWQRLLLFIFQAPYLMVYTYDTGRRNSLNRWVRIGKNCQP